MSNLNGKEQLDQLRHSCAHLLEAAVMELYPNTKLTIGPPIENGFYHDFDFGKVKIAEEDLPKIEKVMQKLLPIWTKFSKKEVSKEEAKKIYKDNPYKLELIDEIAKRGEKITLYKSGAFEDLCRGGHSENPAKDIGAFKLLSIAGAYWRGSEKNPMLTRIYGTCFHSQKELDDYLKQLEEAKKRDHKKLGPQLDLFMFHETAPGIPYWLPKGVTIYNQLLDFWRKEHTERNYQEIMSPLLNKKDLYITSGHFTHYWEEMFNLKTPDSEEYALKAMNCPNAMIVFGSKTRSYKDLPLRLSDTDTLHRYERSGVLNGLLRVRSFRQDDAHCFVSQDLIKEEFENILEIVERFYSVFKLNYSFRLSTRPEKYMGDIKTWDRAEKELKEILDKSGKKYSIESGEGAFYGPKIDIIMKDSILRSWQTGTIQLDFQQPKNFDLKYIDSKGDEKTPITIHRVVYGSLERFIGILIEHYAGAFPLWLSPLQAIILPIADRHVDFASDIVRMLQEKNIRVDLDSRNETVGSKIRDATLQKVPYIGIIGDKEIEKSEIRNPKSKEGMIDKAFISVRTRKGQDLGQIKLSNFLIKLKEEIDKKI